MPSPNNARAAGALALALLTVAFWMACPATASAQTGHAAAPPVMWSDVEVEFEGAHIFKSEHLMRLVRERIEKTAADGYTKEYGDLSRVPYNPDHLEYYLRHDVVNFMRRSGYLRAHTGELRQQMLGRTLAVTVPVEEGELYRHGEVRIEGARHFTAKKLREFLPLKRGDVADGVALTRWLSEHLHRLYGDNGFIQYDYEVEPEFVIEPGAAEGVANFSVTINEGPQFRLRKIAFSGNTRTPVETLRAAFRMEDGEVFSQQKFRDGINRLNNRFDYLDLDGDKDVDFKTDEEAGELEIIIRLTEKAESGAGAPPRGGQ